MSLIESITGDSVFAEILMLRQVDSRSIVLIEGVDDNDTLYAHIDQASARLVIAYGKRNLERAVDLSEARGVERVLGIRDRDFLGVLESLPSSSNIVLTDRYDLDASVILDTDCFAKALPHLADMSVVEGHVAASAHESPVDVVLSLVAEISLARYYSHDAGLGLRTTDFPVHEVATETCDGSVPEKVCQIVASRSEGAVSPADLAVALERVRLSAPGTADIACGHDLLRATAHACRAAWGGPSTGQRVVAIALRSALSCDELMRLELHSQVVAWEQRTGGRVWACR